VYEDEEEKNIEIRVICILQEIKGKKMNISNNESCNLPRARDTQRERERERERKNEKKKEKRRTKQNEAK
jgi:hypothetical protein